MTDSQPRLIRSAVAIHTATVLALLAASFFPELRLWGFHVQAYLPLWAKILLAAIALLPLLLLRTRLLAGRDDSAPPGPGRSEYPLLACTILLLLVGLFIVFRARAHFLGDGYTLLSILSAEDPLFKMREVGESLAHIWLKKAVGLEGEPGALLSFRIIAVTGGVVFTVSVLLAAARLYERTLDRLLFALGLLTGGYMLLFFGYVEYYALFVTTVAVFALVGLAVARGRLALWWLLPPLVVATFFHVLGVTLVPAAAYLFLRRLPVRRAWTVVAVSGAVALAAVVYFYFTNFFFHFALLVPWAHQFTPEGYTLFSPAHLADYLNLLFLLLPGFGLLLLLLASRPVRDHLKEPPMPFVLLLVVSTLGAAFIFDPKLGMPRDWDLFSFAGVPLVLLFYLAALPPGRVPKWGRGVAVLAVALGAISLSARVVEINTPSIAVAKFDHYLQLDKLKNRPARLLLVSYHLERGDTAAADRAREIRDRDFPERLLMREAVSLINRHEIDSARQKLTRAVTIDPLYHTSWVHLAECCMLEKRFDSAIVYLRYALGLGSAEANVYNKLAVCYSALDRPEKAFECLEASLGADSTNVRARYNLALLSGQLGRTERQAEAFARVAGNPGATPEMLKNVALFYLDRGETARGARVLQDALRKGLDRRTVAAIIGQYPELNALLSGSGP